jgi:peptidylprolyl isomerase
MLSPRRLLPIPLLILALAGAGCGDERTASDVEGGGAESTQVEGAATTPAEGSTTAQATGGSTEDAIKDLEKSIGTDLSKAPTIASPTAAAPTKLEKIDLVEGKGTAAKVGDEIDVRYTLVKWGGDATPVDSSWERSPNSSVFPLEQGGLIEGWIQGVPGMKPGGRRLLVVPSDLGYGPAGQPPTIPGDTPLIFVIDLVKAS